MNMDELLEYMRELPEVKVAIPTTTTSYFMECKIVSISPSGIDIELLPKQMELKDLDFLGTCRLSCEKSGTVFTLEAKIDLVQSETRLRLLPRQTSELPQQREFFRIDAVVYLKFWIIDQENPEHPRVTNQMINLSGNGLRFTTDHPLQVGQAIGLELHLPENDSDVKVMGVGRVVRVTDKKWHEQEAALELTELEETEQDKIIRFCLAEQRKLLRMKVHVRA
ncbi:MAG: PilZ domain-containing protein [Desulfuromonadaceae bacterium]|jgi:c-di-GMP-binding flagellar brake protein YcgR